MNQKYPLPSYLSLIFFPIGFFLSYWWKTVNLSKLILGILILSLIGFYILWNFSISNYFFYLLLAINFISSAYLLGLHAVYKQSTDQHYGKLRPITIRWVYVPIATLCAFFAIVVFCMSANGKDIFSFYLTLNFLYEEKLLSLLFVSWIIFLIYSYSSSTQGYG